MCAQLRGRRATRRVVVQGEDDLARLRRANECVVVLGPALRPVERNRGALARLPHAQGIEDRLDQDQALGMLRRVRVERGPVTAGQIEMRRCVRRQPCPLAFDLAAVEADDDAVAVEDRHGNAAIKHLVALGVQDPQRLELGEDFGGLGQRGLERAVAVADAEALQHRSVRQVAPREIVEPRTILEKRSLIKPGDPMQ